MKRCGTCKIEFPKTEEYFFKKIIKQKNKNREAIYYSFRSVCKICYGKDGNKRRVKKRCEDMNCNIDEYSEYWKKQYSETRTLIKEISHLPNGVQSVIRKKIKDGYVFTTYDKYRIDCRINLSKAKRKYDYGDIDFIPKGIQTGIIHLTDAYIALSLKQKVKDVPKEMIEFKRLTIQLKRELENYGKEERPKL